jgi:hypothetical protein
MRFLSGMYLTKDINEYASVNPVTHILRRYNRIRFMVASAHSEPKAPQGK